LPRFGVDEITSGEGEIDISSCSSCSRSADALGVGRFGRGVAIINASSSGARQAPRRSSVISMREMVVSISSSSAAGTTTPTVALGVALGATSVVTLGASRGVTALVLLGISTLGQKAEPASGEAQGL
jgi:hypothetical protein